MKKCLASSLIFIVLGTLAWAQGSNGLFDAKRTQEELEIMKGILRTKLSLAVADSDGKVQSHWRLNDINMFYLSGQGAVFLIPTSSLRSSDLYSWSDPFGGLRQHYAAIVRQNQEIARQNQEIAQKSQQMALKQLYEAQKEMQVGETGTAEGAAVPAPPAVPAAPAPPVIPAPPPPPPPPQIDLQEMGKKLNEARKKLEETRIKLQMDALKLEGENQERLKKLQDETKANREKFLESLAEIKVDLIEVLANYGDSLTTVQADEFINLVLLSDSYDTEDPYGFSNGKTRHDILSVRKSWIIDHKAGRLSLEDFKQRVLQYVE